MPIRKFAVALGLALTLSQSAHATLVPASTLCPPLDVQCIILMEATYGKYLAMSHVDCKKNTKSAAKSGEEEEKQPAGSGAGSLNCKAENPKI